MYLHNIDTKHLHYTYTTHSKTHDYMDKYIPGYTYSTYKHVMYIHACTNLHRSFSVLSVSNIDSNNVLI